MELNFYERPFHRAKYGSWIYDANGNFIFQFERNFTKSGDYIPMTIQNEDKFLEVLNGNGEVDHDFNLSIVNEIQIHNHGSLFVTIRGWGGLTGIGGHGFKVEKAAKIQDDFAQWLLFKTKN